MVCDRLDLVSKKVGICLWGFDCVGVVVYIYIVIDVVFFFFVEKLLILVLYCIRVLLDLLFMSIYLFV